MTVVGVDLVFILLDLLVLVSVASLLIRCLVINSISSQDDLLVRRGAWGGTGHICPHLIADSLLF